MRRRRCCCRCSFCCPASAAGVGRGRGAAHCLHSVRDRPSRPLLLSGPLAPARPPAPWRVSPGWFCSLWRSPAHASVHAWKHIAPSAPRCVQGSGVEWMCCCVRRCSTGVFLRALHRRDVLRWPAERECDLWIKLAVSHAVVNGVMRSPLGCSDATELLA